MMIKFLLIIYYTFILFLFLINDIFLGENIYYGYRHVLLYYCPFIVISFIFFFHYYKVLRNFYFFILIFFSILPWLTAGFGKISAVTWAISYIWLSFLISFGVLRIITFKKYQVNKENY